MRMEGCTYVFEETPHEGKIKVGSGCILIDYLRAVFPRSFPLFCLSLPHLD
jgi:hypothetical protein